MLKDLFDWFIVYKLFLQFNTFKMEEEPEK